MNGRVDGVPGTDRDRADASTHASTHANTRTTADASVHASARTCAHASTHTSSHDSTHGSVQECARQTPVLGEWDVVVVGGGPAGLAAASSAARHGTRTLLVERYGFLGGMGSAGGVTNFAGLYGTRGGVTEGRRQVVEYMRFLRAEVPGFERAEVAEIATQVGVRETRGIVGHYRLTGGDVLGSAKFDDCIGLNAWPVEQHLAGRIEWAFQCDAANAYNHLPWRMSVPLTIDNLLVAGRCASMEHLGQSAARASGACFVMGQAAGTAVALRVAGRFDVSALQAALVADGVDLDHCATPAVFGQLVPQSASSPAPSSTFEV